MGNDESMRAALRRALLYIDMSGSEDRDIDETLEVGDEARQLIKDVLALPKSDLASQMRAEGIERAAKHLEQKAEDYAVEYGLADPSTNTLEFGNTGSEDWYNDLLELATEIRVLAAAPEAK